jgi:hypothetical protein
MMEAATHPRICSDSPGIRMLWVLAVAWCIAISTSPAAALDWHRYESQDGDFSVELPGAPEIRQKKTWFPISSFVSEIYRTWIPRGAFGLNHTDLPGGVMMLAGKSKIIEATRTAMVEDADGTEVSFRETRFLDKPAHELVYDRPAREDVPPLRGTATIFFHDKRLYVFWVEVGEDHPKSDLVRFFDSIRVMDD